MDDNDIVIVSAVRTAITKAKRGGFKDTQSEYLLSAVLSGVCKRAKLPPSMVDDICVGNVLAPGGGAVISRMAMFHAGFPDKTTVYTLNRQCSSGLQAVANIAAALRTDSIKIGIGAGVESMTMHYGPGAVPSNISDAVLSVKQASDCLIPMGITSENVAKEFGISRSVQDEFSADSHKKAASAQEQSLFEEIIPVILPDGTKIDKDDGIRKETSVQLLSKLKPSFIEGGTTTAGNSSQVSDGAAAVLLMKRKTARTLSLPILGTFVDFVVVGVAPHIMGIGPAVAIPELLKRNNLKVSDIDIFEINEAFASQCYFCVKELGIPFEKVNPNGGAIALGHPLGCTGARQIATLMPEMRHKRATYGVTSMCAGTGMGAAALIRNEQAKSKL